MIAEPGGWTDHWWPPEDAQDAVAALIDDLLTEGGTTLWEHYLARKAFPFTTEATTGMLTALMQMTFVEHDDASPDIEEHWELEEEPELIEVDSWARLHIRVRKIMGHGDAASQGTMGGKGKNSAILPRPPQGARTRTSESRPRPNTNARTVKTEKAEMKALPITEEAPVDDWEEQLRDAKTQEEARRREKEKKARESEKTREEELRRVQERREGMDKKAHTFDSEGNIIWVEEIKTDRLPKMQEAFGYAIKKEVKSKSGTGGLEEGAQSKDSTNKDKGAKRPAAAKVMPQATRGKGGEAGYTDGYSRLQHGQPPIIETMTVQPGVTLEAMGKKKAGNEIQPDTKVMSRKEYTDLLERDMKLSQRGAAAGKDASAGGAGGDSPSKGAPSDNDGDVPGIPGAPGSTQLAGGAAEGGSGPAKAPLPPLRRAAPGGGRYPTARSPGDPDAPVVQKAPPAPPPAVRDMGKKFEALGAVAFQKSPRYHAPTLGGPHGLGIAAPPITAVVGPGPARSAR